MVSYAPILPGPDGSERCDAVNQLINRAGCSVQHDTLTVPRLISAVQHILPRRQDKAVDIGSAALHSPAMLDGVAADDFDFDQPRGIFS